MKKSYIAMKTVSKMTVDIEDKSYNVQLPKGCIGVMYVFKKKKHATKFFGNDVQCEQMKEVK
jgi:hypothetical protein